MSRPNKPCLTGICFGTSYKNASYSFIDISSHLSTSSNLTLFLTRRNNPSAKSLMPLDDNEQSTNDKNCKFTELATQAAKRPDWWSFIGYFVRLRVLQISIVLSAKIREVTSGSDTCSWNDKSITAVVSGQPNN